MIYFFLFHIEGALQSVCFPCRFYRFHLVRKLAYLLSSIKSQDFPLHHASGQHPVDTGFAIYSTSQWRKMESPSTPSLNDDKQFERPWFWLGDVQRRWSYDSRCLISNISRLRFFHARWQTIKQPYRECEFGFEFLRVNQSLLCQSSTSSGGTWMNVLGSCVKKIFNLNCYDVDVFCLRMKNGVREVVKSRM
jgi:hypothetical protein